MSTTSLTSAPPTEHADESPIIANDVSEGSLLSRGVALLTPLFAIAAGWLAGVVARIVPGADLNQTQIVAFMTVAATAAIAAAHKWLHGWQAHQQRVAGGTEAPREPQKGLEALRPWPWPAPCPF